MYKVPIKMKIENDFFDFAKRFQKIGEIENETTVIGRKCFDSEGYLSNIKLFLITNEEEADSIRFYNDNCCLLKTYQGFVSDLKEEKENLRDAFEKKAVMDRLNLRELSEEDFYECITGENEKLSADDIMQICNIVDEKLKSDDIQDKIFRQAAEKLAKNIAEYYVTKAVLDDIYCKYGKVVFITGSDLFVKFITAAPVNDKFTRQGKEKVVTDGTYIYIWGNDNLFYKICSYADSAIIRKAAGDKYNGFYMEIVDSVATLEQFCEKNNIELVKVPKYSVDRYDKLDKLLQVAGIIYC